MNASVIRYGKRTTVKFFEDFEKKNMQKLFNSWTRESMAIFQIGMIAGGDDFVGYHFDVRFRNGHWKIVGMDTVFVQGAN